MQACKWGYVHTCMASVRLAALQNQVHRSGMLMEKRVKIWVTAAWPASKLWQAGGSAKQATLVGQLAMLVPELSSESRCRSGYISCRQLSSCRTPVLQIASIDTKSLAFLAARTHDRRPPHRYASTLRQACKPFSPLLSIADG